MDNVVFIYKRQLFQQTLFVSFVVTLDCWVGKGDSDGLVNGLQMASSVLGFTSFVQVSVLYSRRNTRKKEKQSRYYLLP